jgi:hypothetical protein
MRVTTAEFIKSYGALADKALTETVTITKNEHAHLDEELGDWQP